MKYLMILTVGLCLLFTAMPAVAQSAADEAAIRELFEKDTSFFNKHDLKGQMTLCVEDLEGFGAKGQEVYIENTSGWLKVQKDLQYEPLEEIGLTFLTPDVAIFKERFEYTGLVGEDGKALPPQKGIYAGVAVKKDGKWLIAALFENWPLP